MQMFKSLQSITGNSLRIKFTVSSIIFVNHSRQAEPGCTFSSPCTTNHVATQGTLKILLFTDND